MICAKVDRTALAALHAERFAELPWRCASTVPGIEERGEWSDWSDLGTTPDQLRIEHYLDGFDLAGKSILHVGAGNSGLARRFAPRAARIVGTTVTPGEFRHGQELIEREPLPGYRIVLHNKYAGGAGLEGGPFDFIVDNNPTTFACCLEHLADMIAFYAASLGPGGQVVSDRVGLGWSMEHSHRRWGFSPEDLAAIAELAGLRLYRPEGDIVVLARDVPPRPSLSGRAGRFARRVWRKLARLPG